MPKLSGAQHPHCRRRCPGYDQGDGRRRWRALDLQTTVCYVEADAPRVQCKVHEIVVAAVPWARHDAGFTRSFEDTGAWLTVNTSKTAICHLMRIAWRTVGSICARVSAEAKQGRDLFAGLTALGFDEISVRKGQKYGATAPSVGGVREFGRGSTIARSPSSSALIVALRTRVVSCY